MAPHQTFDAASGQFITTPSAEMPGGGGYHDVDLNGGGGGTKDVEGGPFIGDSFTRDEHRRIDKQGTMLPDRELEAQRHGTWVEGVFHIITAVIGGCQGAGRKELLKRPSSSAWPGLITAGLFPCMSMPPLAPTPHQHPPIPEPPPSPLSVRLRGALPALLLCHPGLGGRHHHGPPLWRHHLVRPAPHHLLAWKPPATCSLAPGTSWAEIGALGVMLQVHVAAAGGCHGHQRRAVQDLPECVPPRHPPQAACSPFPGERRLRWTRRAAADCLVSLSTPAVASL